MALYLSNVLLLYTVVVQNKVFYTPYNQGRIMTFWTPMLMTLWSPLRRSHPTRYIYSFLFRNYLFTTGANISGVPMFASNNHKKKNFIIISMNHTRTFSSKNKKHIKITVMSRNILS
jgi:hypothetical protein